MQSGLEGKYAESGLVMAPSVPFILPIQESIGHFRGFFKYEKVEASLDFFFPVAILKNNNQSVKWLFIISATFCQGVQYIQRLKFSFQEQ